MANNKVQKRKYVIGLLVLLAMATVSTYAWSADETLNTDPTKVYVTSSPNSAYTITTYASKPVGKNKIQITFKLAGAVGTPDVGLYFLDSSGNVQTVTGIVKIDGSTITATSGYYTLTALTGTVAGTSHTLTIEESGVWADLDSGTGGNQSFNGIMLVIP